MFVGGESRPKRVWFAQMLSFMMWGWMIADDQEDEILDHFSAHFKAFKPPAVEDLVLLRDGGRGTFHFHDAHSLQWNGTALVGGDQHGAVYMTEKSRRHMEPLPNGIKRLCKRNILPNPTMFCVPC